MQVPGGIVLSSRFLPAGPPRDRAGRCVPMRERLEYRRVSVRGHTGERASRQRRGDGGRVMNILAVSELTGYIAELFESDPILGDIWIRGEVSNCSRPASGHCYFTLKDSGSQVRCVLFKQDAIWQPFAPGNGD